MFRSSPLLGRGPAILLLVAVVAGPLGVAGMAHPADDPLCRPQNGGVAPQEDPTFASTPLVSASTGDQHCLTCHLLRTIRWGISPAVIPWSVSDLWSAPATAICTKVPDDSRLTVPGRSPPLRSARSAA